MLIRLGANVSATVGPCRMRLPAQTRLSVRLTVSQTAGAGAGEIECLIIVICRRLAANLEGEKKKKKRKGRDDAIRSL